ncbi:MAG TPA: ArsA family ATPase [Candidatus Thermoplasmatota archaeon]|nr:ArsA family ATPase [Candidatus Thermoplasmatota archaeon]
MAGPRLSILLGKGGVGRTTVATALAAGLASQGKRVLLLGAVSNADVEARLRNEARGIQLQGRLEFREVNSRALVDELARTILAMGPMTDFILKHPAYDSMVGIMPGVHELALLNLLYNLQKGNEFDHIILDGPATGHGLHFLEAPEKSSPIMAGKLRERAEAIRAMLQDPAATEMIVVTTAEEMPVRETLELAAAIRRGGFHLEHVVVNRWLPAVLDHPGAARVLRSLAEDEAQRAKLSRSIAHKSRINVDQLVTALTLVKGQRDEALEHRGTLESLQVPLSIVPLIPDPEGRLMKVWDALALKPREVGA